MTKKLTIEVSDDTYETLEAFKVKDMSDLTIDEKAEYAITTALSEIASGVLADSFDNAGISEDDLLKVIADEYGEDVGKVVKEPIKQLLKVGRLVHASNSEYSKFAESTPNPAAQFAIIHMLGKVMFKLKVQMLVDDEPVV